MTRRVTALPAALLLALALATPARAQHEVQAVVVPGTTGWVLEIHLDAFERPDVVSSLSVEIEDKPEWLGGVETVTLETGDGAPEVRRVQLRFDVAEDAPVGEMGTVVLVAGSHLEGVEFDEARVELAIQVEAAEDAGSPEEEVEYVAPTLVLTQVRTSAFDPEHRPGELGWWREEASDTRIRQTSVRLVAPPRIKVDEPFTVRGEVRTHELYGEGHGCSPRRSTPVRASLHVANVTLSDTSTRNLGPDCLDEKVVGELRHEDTVTLAARFDPVEVRYRSGIDTVDVDYEYEPQPLASPAPQRPGWEDRLGTIVYYSDEEGHPLFDLPDPTMRTVNRLDIVFDGLVLTYEPEHPGLEAVAPLDYTHPPRPEFPPPRDPDTLATVPDLVRLEPAEARRRMDRWGVLGLELAIGEAAAHPGMSGRIARTEPRAGRPAVRGSTVTAWVAGPFVDTRRVPHVEGMELESARERLEGAGFRVGPVRVVEPRAAGEAATVVAQSLPGGSRAAPGSSIHLSLAGPWVDMRSVPGVVGLALVAARQRLADAGLEAEVRMAEARSAEESGRVVEQSPSEGAEAEAGTLVALSVAGPWADLREVPSVVGVSLPEARAALEGAGFVPKVMVVEARSAREAERVRSQSAAPGTRLAVGTSIGVELAGPWTVAPPPPPPPTPPPPGGEPGARTALACPASLARQALERQFGPNMMYEGTPNAHHFLGCKYGRRLRLNVNWKEPGDPTSRTFDRHGIYISGYARGNVFHQTESVGGGAASERTADVISLSRLANVLVSAYDHNLGPAIDAAQRLLTMVEGRAVSRSRPPDLRGASSCPPGYREAGGTLGQQLTCVPE